MCLQYSGYYTDTETQCQVFHICTSTDKSELTTVSFLCPNGTIFNQNYFICDWWFNFDCSEAEGLYSLNDKIAAEREAASQSADGAQAAYGAPGPAPAPQRNNVKAAPPPPPPAPPAPAADYDEEEAAAPAAAGANYGAPEADTEQPLGTYEAEGDRQGRAFRGGRQQQGRRQQVRGGQQQQGRRGRQQFRG